MDRKLRIGLIVVVVLALAYPAAAWVIGMSVQHQLLEREQLALDQVPYLAVVKRDYRRGIYSSTEEVTFALGGSVLKGLQAAGQDWGPQATFTVRNNIHHGPLPQLRTVAPATIDTEFVLSPAAEQKLVAMVGDQAHLTIHTEMKWGGGSTTIVHSTPFKKDLPGQGGFDWRGLDVKTVLGREVGTQATDAAAPGLIVTTPKGNLSIEDLKVRTDGHQAFDVFAVGKANFSLGHLAIDAPTPVFKLDSHNLTFKVDSSVTGDFVNCDITFAMDSLEAQNFAATQLVWEIHWDHIHGASLASLMKEMRAAQAEQVKAALQSGPNDAAALTQQQMQATQKLATTFQTYGLQILAHDPVIDMPRIGFKTPDGDVMLSLKVEVPGLTPADVSGDPRALMGTLPKYLQATVNASIDRPLLEKLLGETITDADKSNTVKARLQQAQDQGYIKVDGKALTTQVTFLGGQLKINGLPFAPLMAPPPQPQQAPPGKKPSRRVPH